MFKDEPEPVGHAYIQVLQLLDTDGHPYCEMFGNSPVYHHRDGDQWIANKVLAIAKYRFDPLKRAAGLPYGAPMTLAEIKSFQRKAYDVDGYVTWIMHYDPDSTHSDDDIRLQSNGWKALCAMYGHENSTNVFDFYLAGFRRASADDHKRKAPGEQKPLTEKAFSKYKKQCIREGEVWMPPIPDSLTWENAFQMLDQKANELDNGGAGAIAGPSGA